MPNMKHLSKLFLVLSVAAVSQLPLPSLAQTPADTVTVHDSAVVTATRLVFTTKKDTVVYNLDAVVQQTGEMLQDVLRRLPGLELRDGVLYFQGKRVERVLVNGSDFIRDDTKTLVQNLPAYMVRHVKAYERKSDFALRTGIDDGEREQTIDVILKRKYLGSWNVNALTAVGTDDHWRLRGFGMNFTDRSSLTLWGAGNNIADAENGADSGRYIDPMQGQNSGRHTAYRKLGAQAMWGNGIKSGKKGHFKAWGALSWNGNRHGGDLHATARETFYDTFPLFSISRKSVFSNARDISGSAQVEYNLRDETWLEFRPQFSVGRTERRSTDEDAQWRVNPYGDAHLGTLHGAKAFWPLDSILYSTQTAMPGADHASIGSDESKGRSGTYRHTFHFSHRFSPAVEFDLYNTLSYNHARNDQRTTGIWRYYDGTPLPETLTPLPAAETPSLITAIGLLDYARPDRSHDLAHETSANVYVQVAKKVNVRAKYSLGGKRSRSDAEAYRYDREAYDPDYARQVSHTRLPQKAEIGAQYNGKRLFASLALTGSFTRERYGITRSGETQHLRRNTDEYNANLFARLTTDSIGQFEWRYEFSTSAPDIARLVTLPDRTAPAYRPLGNAALRDARTHYARFHYGLRMTNMAWFNLVTDFRLFEHRIVTASTYDAQTGITTTQPRNVGGAWQASTLFLAGASLDGKKRLNAMLTAGCIAARDIGWQNRRYAVLTHTPMFSLRLSYNKGKTGAELATQYEYSTRRSPRVGVDGLNNQTWTNTLSLRTTLPLGIEADTELRIRWQHMNKGIDYEPFYCLWNASLQRSFLREKNLTLRLSAADILGQLRQGGPFASATSRGYQYTETLRSYVLVSLLFRFATKKH